MSVRVVARVRPLLKSERELDVIVRTGSSTTSEPAKSKKGSPDSKTPAALKDRETIIRIPNPKNEGEQFVFQFNAVYGPDTTQQEIFDAEVAPTVKHLFNGFDVTIFAYGVTGTGKTHTMRGGKSLADRGVIPRLLSSIYRRSRKIEKDSEGATKVEISMSYYEIYNDKVYDLFEPPEKRTLAGLPLRDNGGKTVVVGLTERPCTSLKEFESLYDQANTNRSTSATKLNAHSSRSHAILCVKISVTTGEHTRVSTASAIDLAGSEDNRRTENDKERMVESASINKSLFVLAQCVEAISKKHPRIPYRESKMTRILSLGQNNGLTLMILNLAPVRAYHLDTLSSLNFANRTKKIEVREVENEPIFKGPPRPIARPSGAALKQRQPLRPLTSSVNANLTVKDPSKQDEKKPVKAFFVYSDKQPAKSHTVVNKPEAPRRSSSSSLKRNSDTFDASARPAKTMRYTEPERQGPKTHKDISAAKIEELVEKKVEEILAARALDDSSKHQARVNEINEQVQRRLELLEKRIEGTEDARAEGLSYLLMAKQHHARGEDSSALKMYKLALPFFPHNQKLAVKISALEEKIRAKKQADTVDEYERGGTQSVKKHPKGARARRTAEMSDEEYMDSEAEESNYDDDSFSVRSKQKRTAGRSQKARLSPRVETETPSDLADLQSSQEEVHSPRTAHLLSIINSRDVSQIKLLKGVGAKKAEAIVDCLCEMDHQMENADAGSGISQARVKSLAELGRLKGVGMKTVQNMRSGVVV
ncbi:hypothetical protein VTN77DRAFT_7555 [Rasamsonia byssochlamydoides]|uniref:uncharacterized protein n=1 Tax=Rasamsonia byssochlamydoides TaxID=89139 RepID=UPI00374418A8